MKGGRFMTINFDVKITSMDYYRSQGSECTLTASLTRYSACDITPGTYKLGGLYLVTFGIPESWDEKKACRFAGALMRAARGCVEGDPCHNTNIINAVHQMLCDHFDRIYQGFVSGELDTENA